MLHSLLVLHYTDVVASVAVQKAPKEGDYRVSEVLEYYMVKERSPQKNAQKYAIRLEKYLYILFWTINKVDMRIFIGKPLHVLEVPYYKYQNIVF